MCLLTTYSDGQIQEAETDGAYGTFVEEQKYIQFLQGNLKEREYFVNICVDWRTELKFILQKQDGNAWSG